MFICWAARNTRGTFIAASLLLTSFGTFTQAQRPGSTGRGASRDGVILFSFESASELEKGTVVPEGVQLYLTGTGVTDGKQALRVDFPMGGNPGLSLHPASVDKGWERGGADTLLLE